MHTLHTAYIIFGKRGLSTFFITTAMATRCDYRPFLPSSPSHLRNSLCSSSRHVRLTQIVPTREDCESRLSLCASSRLSAYFSAVVIAHERHNGPNEVIPAEEPQCHATTRQIWPNCCVLFQVGRRPEPKRKRLNRRVDASVFFLHPSHALVTQREAGTSLENEAITSSQCTLFGPGCTPDSVE